MAALIDPGKRVARTVAALVLLGLGAAPAAAQNGAMWVDKHGRMMSFNFAGGNGSPPAPVDVAPADMAARFNALCLGGDTAAAAAQAGLTADPVASPFGKEAGAPPLGIWHGPGVVVSQSAAPLVQVPQCNVTHYVATLPDRQSVADALAAVLGSPPSNLAAATDKKGRPKKYYSPEWQIGGAQDARVVAAYVQKGSQFMPGNRVQISVRAAKKAGK